jgi:hypothetical protein
MRHDVKPPPPFDDAVLRTSAAFCFMLRSSRAELSCDDNHLWDAWTCFSDDPFVSAAVPTAICDSPKNGDAENQLEFRKPGKALAPASRSSARESA